MSNYVRNAVITGPFVALTSVSLGIALFFLMSREDLSDRLVFKDPQKIVDSIPSSRIELVVNPAPVHVVVWPESGTRVQALIDRIVSHGGEPVRLYNRVTTLVETEYGKRASFFDDYKNEFLIVADSSSGTLFVAGRLQEYCFLGKYLEYIDFRFDTKGNMYVPEKYEEIAYWEFAEHFLEFIENNPKALLQ